MAVGERMSSLLIGACLQNMHIPVCVIDAGQVMKTDSKFGDSNPNFELTISELITFFSSTCVCSA